MTIEDYKSENEQLHNELVDTQADFKQVVGALVSVMSAVGLSPKTLMSEPDPMKQIIKAVPSLLTDLTINPLKVDMQFAPLKELAPLLEKYKHLIED